MPAADHLRADAARNREMLLVAATRAFAAAESEPSMRAIAREAGVGVATLYRHFPTRESLVDAVYHDQVKRLIAGARALLKTHPPAEALRLWMDLFAEWLATKHGMLDTLVAMIDSDQIAHVETREQLLAAITTILDAGRAGGDIRPDANAEDIAAGLTGIFTVAGTPAQHPQAGRLLDLLMDGLRPRTGYDNDSREKQPRSAHYGPTSGCVRPGSAAADASTGGATSPSLSG